MGEEVKLVDPAKATAKQVKQFLQEKGIVNLEEKEGERTFYLSDYTDMFYSICQKALKQGYAPEIIDIEQY